GLAELALGGVAALPRGVEVHVGRDSPPGMHAPMEIAVEPGDVEGDDAGGEGPIGVVGIPTAGPAPGRATRGGDGAELLAIHAEGVAEEGGDGGEVQVEVRADRVAGRIAGGGVSRL